MSYSPKMFSQWSEYASRIEAALKNVKDPLAKETLEKLVEHHSNVRDARRKIEMKVPERDQLRNEVSEVGSRLRACVDGCIALGTGLKLGAISDFAIERSDDRNSAMDLERLFKAEGDMGEHIAKRVVSVRNQHERAADELAKVEAQLAKLDREYSAELSKLQGFIGAAKAVLQINEMDVPTRRVGRGSKKKPVAIEAASVEAKPRLTVVEPTAAMPVGPETTGSIAA